MHTLGSMRPPDSTEYAEFFETYVARVPERSVLEVLADAPEAVDRLLSDVTPGDETFAYADGKWSIRELLGHVIDAERLFSYRALHIARGDPAPLPGMDHDLWVAGSNAHDRSVATHLEEFRSLRAANVLLFSSFDEETLSREGVASGVRFSVRSLIYVVAGHELHHRDVLADRYLGALVGDLPDV